MHVRHEKSKRIRSGRAEARVPLRTCVCSRVHSCIAQREGEKEKKERKKGERTQTARGRRQRRMGSTNRRWKFLSCAREREMNEGNDPLSFAPLLSLSCKRGDCVWKFPLHTHVHARA